MRAIRNILVPTDFSGPADRALSYARDMADAFGASLHVLHVVHNPFAPGAFMEMYSPPPGDYVGALEREARAHLAALFTEEDAAKYRVQLLTRIGAPAPQILEYIREEGTIDLVVLATTGRGAVARLMMGSVTDRVVRTAPCPVLTIHPHDGEDVATPHRAA